MNRDEARIWKSETFARQYLDDVRGAIPLAAEQLDVLRRIVGDGRRRLRSFLDLGCGDGILAATLLDAWPRARGVLVDFSEPMLLAAREKLGEPGRDLVFLGEDYGRAGWVRSVREAAGSPFDAVVSGYSIHHQPDRRKRALYREIFDLLAPGGVFVNMEHVASAGPRVERIHEERFIDSLHAAGRRAGSGKSRARVARAFRARLDKAANLLTPVERQCTWLRRIGFEDVDCFFKHFELAVFGGWRPRG
jgi:SAM-dependent methyltransferase